MAKQWVTNNHTTDLEFELASGGAQILKPGESAHISIKDFDAPHQVGKRHAGLYVVTDTKPGKDDVVPDAATTTRPTTSE